MNKIMHSIEPEELMAYLDGELAADREAEAAAHLKECAECQSLAADLRGVSQSLKGWEVGPSEEAIPPAIAEALREVKPGREAVEGKARGWRGFLRRRWGTVAWAGGVAVLLVVVGTLRFIGGNASSVYDRFDQPLSARPESAAPALPSAGPSQGKEYDRIEQYAKLQKAPAVKFGDSINEGVRTVDATPPATGPMIIRTASLSLITKDFDKARAQVESILKRHRGYIGELKVGGSTGAGRTLTGTLRVPADQLDATIADLKPLGRVESESQGGEDVTSQYVDLEARLANARNTERRLTDLLSQRTGKLSDVLEVERELDRVRGEIEQMVAERKTMATQVAFATLNLTISEDYKAQLQVVPPSTSTRLSNAAVEGYRSAVDGVLDLTLFLLSTGPSLLLWAAALFLPARYAWKTMRRKWQA